MTLIKRQKLWGNVTFLDSKRSQAALGFKQKQFPRFYYFGSVFYFQTVTRRFFWHPDAESRKATIGNSCVNELLPAPKFCFKNNGAY